MQGLPFVWPLSGGLLIGLSAALYLLLNGRIAGISGLAASVFGVSGAGHAPARSSFSSGFSQARLSPWRLFVRLS